MTAFVYTSVGRKRITDTFVRVSANAVALAGTDTLTLVDADTLQH